MKNKVVVTGGAGFIGSHLTSYLVKQGYNVCVLDDLSSGKREWVPEQAVFLEGSVLDKKICNQACINARGIFHLAAISSVPKSVINPQQTFESNVLGTQNILEAAKKNGVKKFILSSTSALYGMHSVPHKESLTPEILNPYALSKFMSENLCLLYSRIYGVSSVILRYFNVYGARQPNQSGEGLVIGIFLKQLKENKPLTIHGEGTQERDFVHVSDVVQANIQAFQCCRNNQTFNVGSGHSVSIKELANLITTKQVFTKQRKHESISALADIKLIKKHLQWEPKISIRKGLAHLMAKQESS